MLIKKRSSINKILPKKTTYELLTWIHWIFDRYHILRMLSPLSFVEISAQRDPQSLIVDFRNEIDHESLKKFSSSSEMEQGT